MPAPRQLERSRPSVAAVSARARDRDRGVDLSKARWYDDPVQMARDAEGVLVMTHFLGPAAAEGTQRLIAVDTVPALVQLARQTHAELTAAAAPASGAGVSASG